MEAKEIKDGLMTGGSLDVNSGEYKDVLAVKNKWGRSLLFHLYSMYRLHLK